MKPLLEPIVPTAEGKRRYPPDGIYHAPEGLFTEPASDVCTCTDDCSIPCMGEGGCECMACSLLAVVHCHDGNPGPQEHEAHE